MIRLQKTIAAAALILTTTALPVEAFSQEVNFGILGAIFAPKTEAAPEAATPPAAPQAEADAPAVKGKHKKKLADGANGSIKALIVQHANANGVPVQLADAIVRIESRYNPRATNHGAMGLMQIKPQTARGVGFSGSAGDLLNPDTNLRYGMKYLAHVYAMSGGNVCATVMRYQTGVAATHLSAANRAYCAKAKAIMG